MSEWSRRSGVTDPYDNRGNYYNPQNIKEVLVAGPTQTIVSLAEARNYLKETSGVTVDDDLITDIVNGSTAVIEKELGGISLYEQTWKQYQQGGCETIELLRSPIIGTPTVSYYPSFSTVTATNVTATTYFRAVENELYHVDGYWDEGRAGDGYVIEYTTGLFTASNYTSSDNPVLGTFKTAILRTCAWLFEQREEHVGTVNEGQWSVTYDNENLPQGIKRLVMPFCTGRNIM